MRKWGAKECLEMPYDPLWSRSLCALKCQLGIGEKVCVVIQMGFMDLWVPITHALKTFSV